MQNWPHESSLSGWQLPLPQSCVPTWQVRLQETPLQVAVPNGSVGHAEQLEPHEFTLEFETQLPLQLWKPPLQLARKQVPAGVLHAPVPFEKAIVQLTRPGPQMVSLFASQPPLKR